MRVGLTQSVLLVLSHSNCLTLRDSKDCRSLARLLCPWEFPGKSTGVGYHFPLQGIFLTQGSKLHLLCLLHCRWILYLLSHWGSPSNQLKGGIRGNSSCLTTQAATLVFPTFRLKTLALLWVSSLAALRLEFTPSISSPGSQAFELGLQLQQQLSCLHLANCRPQPR